MIEKYQYSQLSVTFTFISIEKKNNKRFLHLRKLVLTLVEWLLRWQGRAYEIMSKTEIEIYNNNKHNNNNVEYIFEWPVCIQFLFATVFILV